MAKTEKKPSFEESISQLEDILGRMSGEEVGLDESIELYAKAAQLIRDCSVQLDEAQKRVEEIGMQIEQIGDYDDI